MSARVYSAASRICPALNMRCEGLNVCSRLFSCQLHLSLAPRSCTLHSALQAETGCKHNVCELMGYIVGCSVGNNPCCNALMGCRHCAVAGKEAGEGAAEIFKEMAAQAGLTLRPVPVVDGQLDL